MKNKQDNYGSLSHVLLFKDKHLMVFWNKDIHVYDTLNVKEIELYHMEHEIAKVRFSYDHSLIMAYAVGGQIYVINRKGNTISKGDCLKIRYSNKFYEPPYEESILMHINKDNGFVLVVLGNIKQKYINDWYYLDKNGHVIKTCSFTEIDKNDCNLDESTLPVFNRVINNPDEDDCYILGYAFFPYIYKFDPETSNVTKLFHIGWNQKLKSLDYLEIRPDNLFIKRDLFVFSGINKKRETCFNHY